MEKEKEEALPPKKPLHARTRQKMCQFCAISLQKQAIFGGMWQ